LEGAAILRKFIMTGSLRSPRLTVRVRVDAGGETVADSAGIGLDATGYCQQVAVLGDRGSNQIFDQRSQQLKCLAGLLQDGCEVSLMLSS